jgi:hypothetical protein
MGGSPAECYIFIPFQTRGPGGSEQEPRGRLPTRSVLAPQRKVKPGDGVRNRAGARGERHAIKTYRYAVWLDIAASSGPNAPSPQATAIGEKR